VGKGITKDKSNSSITFLKKCDEYDIEVKENDEVDIKTTVFDRGKISTTEYFFKSENRPGKVKFGRVTVHVF